ncbi:yeast-form wall Protein 1 [[Candida] railenensis]|uniref:Yeast-form wall Protein 1 n=1 Tax=[Candida] railenensis TaxID=45579 RepID=A0A9P0QLI6_9ASCO|nr:yeast-form wall Protein 1 [[Candida] railenensis]
MVSYKSLAAAALMSASTLAVDVDCLVNGVSVATVDLDTGVCPFTVPISLPVLFEYTSENAYDVEFYYVDVPPKYYTDIEAAGREIDIPANALYGKGSFSLHQVHVTKTPSTNSTEAIRRRLMKESLLARDEVSDFVASLEGIEGTEIEATVEVVLASTASSSGSGSGSSSTTSGSGSGSVTSAPGGTATVTDKHTTVVTITSCSDHKCVLTTVPATPSEIVTTVNEEVTTYTTYCPLTGDETETVTHASTKIVTITSCSDNKCSEATVPATASVVTTTVEAVESIYTTWCPVDTTETVVSESTEYYTATTVATSEGEVITKTTVIPVVVETTEYYTPVTTTYTSEGSVITATTVAPVTETPVTTTYTSGGAVVTATTVAAVETTPATEAEASETTITLESTTYKTAVSESTAAAETTVATTSSGSAATSGAVTIPASENVAGASKASMLALIVIPLAYFI